MSLLFNQTCLNEKLMPNYIYIYILFGLFIYMCVCVWLGSNLSFKQVWINNQDTFCVNDFNKILSSFQVSVFVSDWKWWMNLPKLPRALSDLLVFSVFTFSLLYLICLFTRLQWYFWVSEKKQNKKQKKKKKKQKTKQKQKQHPKYWKVRK